MRERGLAVARARLSPAASRLHAHQRRRRPPARRPARPHGRRPVPARRARARVVRDLQVAARAGVQGPPAPPGQPGRHPKAVGQGVADVEGRVGREALQEGKDRGVQVGVAPLAGEGRRGDAAAGLEEEGPGRVVQQDGAPQVPAQDGEVLRVRDGAGRTGGGPVEADGEEGAGRVQGVGDGAGVAGEA